MFGSRIKGPTSQREQTFATGPACSMAEACTREGRFGIRHHLRQNAREDERYWPSHVQAETSQELAVIGAFSFHTFYKLTRAFSQG